MFDPFVQFVASYLAYIENLITSPVFIAVVIFAGGLFIHDLWQRRQEEGWKRRQFDNMVTSLLILFANVLFSQLMVVVSAWLRTGMETIGVPTISASVWDGWPPLLVFFIYLAARDFVDYWNHRFMHMPWLWPIHAVHHSDTDVNVFTAYRVHLLEGLLMRVTHIVALSWMGASPEAIGMIVFFIEMHLFYVHANLNWDHGPFKFVIASPRFHRWHHADKPEAYGKNLANMIPAYDWMFGTYYNPEPCRERMGAPGVPDTDTVALMFSPFTLWREQWEKSFGKKPMTAPDDTASPAPSAQS